ncbi:MAG: right-handed parallel beta-helix repeat-containing protein [Burkholderiales bacterium]|nr:right-handed parallel beta-helix repeat-containing protein [Burkholderiales bacterium]
MRDRRNCRDRAIPPFARKPLFESLEQRLLLSADIAPAAATGLIDGMQALRDWAGGLQSHGAMAQALPMAQAADSISIGAALDLATLFDQKLFAPVQAYLGGGGTKTTDGLVGALGAVAGISSVSGDQVGDELRFDVVLDAAKALPGLKINIGATQDGTQVTTDANGAVDATGNLLLDFSFGFDLDAQLAPEEAFFLDVDAFEASVTANAAGLDFGANIGFLGANVANGSFNLDAGLAVALNNPDADGEGRITLGELLGTTLEGLVVITPTDTPEDNFSANFPISVSLGSFIPASTRLTVAGNALDPASIIVKVEGSSAADILNFGRANQFGVVEALRQIGGWLDSLDASEAFAQNLPFAQGTTFSELLELGQAFSAGFLDQIESAPGVPAFANAQQFAQEVADLMYGGDTAPVALNYNASTNQLTFHLRLDRTFAEVEAPVAFSVNLAPLNGLASSSNLQIGADGRIEFTIGFDLSPFVATWAGNVDLPLNGVLTGDASFTVRVNEAAESTLITVPRDPANTTRSALIADINAAISAAGVSGLTASLQSNKLRLTVTGNALGANLQFGVPSAATNPAKLQLGLPAVGFASDGLTSKTFLRDIRVTGHADFSASDIEALGGFGIFQVGIDAGTIAGQATVNVLVRKGGNAATPIFMGELYQVVNDIAGYTAITRTGNVTGTLPIALQGAPIIALPGSPRVQFSMGNVFQPATTSVTFADLGPLLAYQNFDVSDVIAGLTSLAGFFNTIEGYSHLDRKLPLLNRSVTDLVSFVDDFQAAVTYMQNAGNVTLQALEQKLEQAFAVAPSALSLSMTANDLRINLHLAQAIPAGLRKLAMDLDLGTLGAGNPDLAGVGHLIDVQGSDKLDVDAAAVLDLGFGFDLSTPSNPRAYVRDDTEVSWTARVSGNEIDFDAAIGPLGVSVRNGTARLDNGVGIPASFGLTLDAAGGDKWYTGSWGTGILNATVAGQVHATLPIYYPLPASLFGNIELDIGNLANIAGTTTLTSPDLAAEIEAINLFDDMDALVRGIDLLLASIQNGLQSTLAGIDLPIIGDALADKANFVERLRSELVSGLQAEFADGSTSVAAVQTALFAALGPAGLNVLPGSVSSPTDILYTRVNDAGADAARIEFDLDLHADDSVAILIPFDLGLPGLGLSVADATVLLVLEYNMKLGFGVSRSQGVYLKTYDGEDELRIGVSATLEDAAVGGTLGFLRVRVADDASDQTQLAGSLGINLTDPDDRITYNELAGGANPASLISVGLDLAAEANLLLVAGAPNVAVTDPAAADFFLSEFPQVEAEFNMRWVFTPGGAATGVLEQAELDNVRLDLGKFFSGFLTPIFDFLNPIVEVAQPLIDVLTEPLPVFSDLAGASYTLVDLAQDLNGGGNFISDEALDFLDAVLLLADMAGEIASYGGSGVYLEFGGVDLKSFDLKNPNFTFSSFGASLNPLAGKQINTPAQSLAQQLDDKAHAFALAKGAIKGTDGSGFDIPLIDSPLRVFDLLLGRDVDLFRYDMPEFAFEFSHRWRFGPLWWTPPVFVTLSGGIEAGFNFGFGYDTSGLRKLSEQINDGGPVNPTVVLDGFFVADWDASGIERPEAYLEGKIGAGAEVNLVVVSAGAEGGIFVRAGLDLHDPDHDGRMHGSEILEELLSGGSPICLFDFFGEIGAYLSVYVEVGFWPISYTLEMEIARVTLLDWEIDVCHEDPPILATQVGGDLYLNMGPRAANREHGDVFDGEEEFIVKNLADGTVMVEAFGITQVYGKYNLDSDGELVEFGDSVTRIIADGGEMDDSIQIAANVPMVTELKGGAGDDVLIAGGGAAFIQGGAGKDSIYGGVADDELYGDMQDGGGAEAADVIRGGDGNDRMFGGGGDDYLYGEKDDDEIHGDAGEDRLFGQSGRDRLFGDADGDGLFGGLHADKLEGGSGTDYLIGGDAEAGMADELYGFSVSGTGDDNTRDYLYGDEGAGLLPDYLAEDAAPPGGVEFGDDLLFGQGGSDYLYGETGLDTIFGADGADFIFGGDGADNLHGGDGDDDIRGNAGADLINGDAGADSIRGDQGDDVIRGDEGSDTILGGSGKDMLFGGDDGDLIRGQEDDDEIFGEAGDDDLHGDSGHDILVGGDGDDAMNGGAHDDRLFGSAGNDTIHGSAGHDLVYGESGIDALYGNAGDDVLYGGSEADTIHGGDGSDFIYGETGIDALYGDAGDDYLDGGTGADGLYGGSGDDTLMAGSGLGKQLYGEAGDDLIIGTAEGYDDDDLLDSTYFGDIIHGGDGDDRLYGLAGADTIHGEAGDDEIWGGAHTDYLLGGTGFDRIHGGIGADRIEGGDDGDEIDGGFGADQLFGDDGDDEILGGGGMDQIAGGAGDDVLRGSDDAPDTIHGDAGADRIFGNRGNDVLYGDSGNDIIDGGSGDDTLEGGLGSDVLLGGAHHDILRGHLLVPSPADDAAVDYLYGDFGTNLDDADAGADRLFGHGGNDLLFGEGGDDAIDSGAGLSYFIDFGAGEGADPEDLGVFLPTLDPLLFAPPDEPYALPQLPAGITPGGRWTEFAGSASGTGVSNSQAAAIEPALAIDADGNRYVAWADARNGNTEIYVLRYSVFGGWEMLAGSAEGRGISATLSDSRRPSIAIGNDGNPVVAWTERVSTTLGVVSNIRVAKFDPAAAGGAGAWVALGASLDAGGISATGAADHATVLITESGPVVTWLDGSSGTSQVYARRFLVGAWSAYGAGGASGGGATSAPVDVEEYAATTDGAEVAIAFSRLTGSDYEVYLTRSNGGAWAGIGGSTTGSGLSDNAGDSRHPTVAYHDGTLFVAWQDQSDLHQEIYARYFDGAIWVRAGDGAADGQGVSATTGIAAKPRLAVNGDALYLAWMDHSTIERPDNAMSLYVKRWTGTRFASPSGDDAAHRGISPTARQVQSLALAIDASGRPYLAWDAVDSGAPQVYLRGNLLANATVHQVDSSAGLQALLDGGSLGAGHVVILASGNYDGTISIDADAAGVAIVGDGALDTVLTGTVNITDAANVTLQRLRFTGDVHASGTNFLTLTDNRFLDAGLRVSGDTNLRITHNSFSGEGGITIAAAASGRITDNDIGSVGIGVAIDAAFSGLIDHNDIHGASVGVAYNAAAALAANRIRDNGTGVHSTVNGANALGFVAGSQPNTIHDNLAGIELSGARVQGQHVHENSIGIRGSGTLGGDTLDLANRIEHNGYGVAFFTGTVQFNRIGHNTTGVQATDGLKLQHNLIYRNESRGLAITSASDVRVYQNTFYAPAGDNIRVSGGAANVEIRGNIVWAESGYDIYVANDSQSGYFSDYNDLYVTDGGRIGYWTKDFTDILDWQADIARFDLHSIGHTVIDPTWARPRFMDVGQDDYRLFAPVAALRFTSPTIDAADARTDWLRPASEANLLANPGFETGLGGWTTNVGGATRNASPNAFEGSAYYAAGSIEEGHAEQVIDLLAEGYTAAELDLSDLEIVFSGRLRSSAEAAADRGKIRITFLSATATTLGEVEAAALNESTRWELVGGRTGIPVGTRLIAYRFIADRETGATNDAYLDHAFLGIVSENAAPDIGAYGHAATDVGLATTPRINLRFPELYTDWEKDKPLTIRWETFGNSGDTPVRIDLYQDVAGGPALRTTIAAATPDDGEFIWIPSTSGVDFGTYGLRIQVSLNTNHLVLDRSAETFTVPEDGQNYWVDDATNIDDEYTPGAVGDNRNTGKLATAPKPNPVNLVRTYALNADASLYIDTGTYPLIDPLSLSGTFDLGLGLDEGFRMTGPENTARVASLRPAIPGDRTRSLILLNDADFVTIEHLSLANALRGLDVTNGSESFNASWLTAYGHAAEGMRIATNSPFADIHHLTAYGNDDTGIDITGPIATFAHGLAYDNDGDGIALSGGVGLVRDTLAHDNDQIGIRVSNPGAGARIEGNIAYGNNTGMSVSGGTGAPVIVGHTDLALGRGNLAYGNVYSGISGGSNTLIVGNTARDQIFVHGAGITLVSGASARHNIATGNYFGIDAQGAGEVKENRAYDNRGFGIDGSSSAGFIGNVVYSNPTNIRVDANTLVRNNLLYDSTLDGIYLPDNSGTRLVSNTIVAAQGNAIRIQSGSDKVELRNNIIAVGSGYGISVAADSQTGFVSDYNLFHVSGGGDVGLWQSIDRPTLTAWRNATFGDKNSLYGDPLFVDPDGADGVAGYVSPANDGRDDDYHLLSQFGSFKGASFAPVLSAGTGLPVLLPPSAATLDAATSPAIDRGAPGDAYSSEPANNGGYINIGAYGNTAQASKSPAQYLLVTNPNGGEAVPQESTSEIRWRSSGFDGNVAIEIAHDTGAPVWEIIAGDETNDGSYVWSVNPAVHAIGDDYLIRVRALLAGSIQDGSDAAFSITPPISIFYVNDNALAGDQYTTAVGNDANDGLTPATPKATIRSVLESYDLELGDVIRVDTGNYLLTANIVLGAEDSGVSIVGPTAPGARAVINRGNITTSNYVFQLTGADDVTLRNLAITGAQQGVFVGANVGSERLTVERSELYGNAQRGAFVQVGNFNAVFNDNEVYLNGSWGLQIDGAGASLTGNHVWTNGGGGISVTNNTSSGRIDVVGNSVHDNSGTGIDATHWAYVADNAVYGNLGSYGIVLDEARALAEGNEVFLNPNGISLGIEAVARENRVYANSGIGIKVQGGSTVDGGSVEHNIVYDNTVGIEEYKGRVAYNLVYDNVSAGIVSAGNHDDGLKGIRSNTVAQPTGDAIRLGEGASEVLLRDNVLEVGAGYAINVPASAQDDFASDYNLFSLVGSGKIGFWNRAYSNLEDWIYAVGTDQESLAADPRFIDPAGSNAIRGFDTTPLSSAIVIDDGDPGFSAIGAWTSLVGSNAAGATTQQRTIFNNSVGNDIQQIPGGGDGTSVARWSFEGLADGTYQIAAHWPTGSGLSGLTTMQYRSYDGAVAVENVVATGVLNQFFAPNDFSADGTTWEHLDTVTVRNGTLIVELSNLGGSTSSRVTADAMRVQRIPGDLGNDDDFRLGAGSGAIDRADPAGRYEQEPVANGNRADLGAFGNSVLAAPSDAQLVQVLNPNGLEKLESDAAVRIDFLTAGLALFEPALLMNLGGGAVGDWVSGDPPASGGSSGNSMYGDPQVLDLTAPNAGPEAIYRDFRTSSSGVNGTMGWTFAVPDGEYVVRLHFIEATNYSSGQRRFDVSLQGVVVDADLNIFAVAGRNKALVLEHAVTVEEGAGIALQLKNLTSVGATIAGIEILRVNQEGVVAPTVDLETSTDGGSSWTPLASGLAVDRFGRGSYVTDALPQANAVLIRATGHAGGVTVRDVSDAPFQVANAGNAYFVNDASLAGDEYATAVGNNANDGKTAATPMVNLAALLRAYDLDPGDVIYVDTGTYLLTTNIVLDAEDSGVTIRGPVLGGHAAVLDRDNATESTDSYVFELNGADDVTIEHVDMTGAVYGVYSASTADSDRVTVARAKIYGHTQDGISINAGSAEFFTVRDSEIYDNEWDGISVYSRGGRILNNLVHDNRRGVFAVGASGDEINRAIASGNAVYDNTEIGIESTANTVFESNTVHDNGGYGIAGVADTKIRDNVVYANNNGILLRSGAIAENNRVFDHTGNGTSSGIGIRSEFAGTVRGNQVYGNTVGVSFSGRGEVRGNVIYGNVTSGVNFSGNLFKPEEGVHGNTIYQLTGDAVVVGAGANVVVRDNILAVGSGYAIRVASDAQAGFVSDYNLFWLTGTGKIAFWEDRAFLSLTDWALEVGYDFESLVANPMFVDINGADGVLGFSAGVDRGADDDFRLRADSPAVDRGDPSSRYEREPASNGARVDLGAYGNTPLATRSTAQLVQVLNPNGLEKFERGDPIRIDVHTAGLARHDPVLLMHLGGNAVSGPGHWAAGATPDDGASAGTSGISASQPLGLDAPNAAPDGVYRTSMASFAGVGGTLGWTFAVPDGAYTVRLHFIEPTETAAGRRRFDIELQGAIVEDDLDIYAEAGGRFEALVREFEVTAADGEGIALQLRNLTSIGAIISGIEILRENPLGVASPSVDLAVSKDDGSTWIPVAGGVDLDRYGDGSFLWNSSLQANAVLIRARAHAGGVTVQDVSDAPFQIANAGKTYYVNDGSLAGDEYASAIGNNANDGKSAATPMASLAALLRAYDLDPGDVIHVDTGVYNLTTNIVLTAQDSGVTIRGPVLITHDAVLDRGNTGNTAMVFQFTGATDVTLESLNLTGGFEGIDVIGSTGNDRVTLRFMDIYSNADEGIELLTGHSDWFIADSRIHNNATKGIAGQNAERLRIERNEIYGNDTGLLVTAGSAANQVLVLGNDVHDNAAIGISAGSNAVIRGNRVYNHGGSGDFGISVSAGTSLVEDNDVYVNATGISVTSGTPVTANRVYDNGVGIRSSGGIVSRNQVYSNSTGIVDASGSQVFGNLIYANTNVGLDIAGGHTAGARVAYSNTIWQDTGSAIRAATGSNHRLRDNVVSIGTGYAIDVATAAQSGFSSDWNLIELRTASGQVGRWGTTERPTLASWRAVSANHDANGMLGDPKFLDINGADNVLGDQDLATGDGYDDNFSLDADSPAIDAGSAYEAALLDIEGRERRDDPSTANTGIGWDRFVESVPGGSSFAATGTTVGISGSNGVATVALPFDFAFYGTVYTSVQVSANGYLHFGGLDAANVGDDNTQELFLRNIRIAPLWDNLDSANVRVDSTVAEQITIRWAASRHDAGGGVVNFSVTLFENGNVRFDYGAGNRSLDASLGTLTPTVGLSAGNGFTFVLSQYNGAADLNNAASVLFTPNEGLTYFDIGAYEFLGDSGDTTAPTVTLVSQVPAPGGSTAAAFSAIQVGTSEALNSISAKSPANYDLRREGVDGMFDTADDVIVPLRPLYSFPETNLTLEFLLGAGGTPGILPEGDYRLTLSGTKAIYDLSGNPLDGNGDGVGGDDYVRYFTIDRTLNVAPVANAQALNVSEDGEITITLSASDGNGDPLAYSLVTAPVHGTLADFDPAARTVVYRPDAGYTGADSFQFSADDGNAGVGTATITLNVQPVNDAPVAAAQSVVLDEDTPRLIVLDGADTETARENLVFTLVTAPEHGSITQGLAGGWTYTPDANYFGPDSFTYTVTDRGDPDGSLANVLTSAAATIDITVTPVNDGPQLGTIIDQVVAEGSILLVDVAATDSEGESFAFSLDEAPAGAAIDTDTGLFTWTPADGAQSAQVTVRVINAGLPDQFDTETFTINVTNVAPTLAITGAADAVRGQAYPITLAASDPGDDTIVQWDINWGDGQSSVLPGTATSASHVYALGGAAYSISAQATDEDGTFDANTIAVAVAYDTLRVQSIEATSSGFKARFSHIVDPTVINLYSGEMPPAVAMGPADVLLTGAATGAVRGSLVFDADGAGFTFVRTGGVLAADTYTLTLKSGDNAFKRSQPSADPLDGDDDGVAGGDFSDTFTVSAPTLPVLAIADVARANAQPIDIIPATASGLPIWLSNGAGIESIAFTLKLRHDPAAPATDPMIVSAIALAPDLPTGAVLAYDLRDPGVIPISVSLPAGTTFDAAAGPLVIIRATVGADATYAAKQVLDLDDIAVNGMAGGASDDDGVQVVALLGDASGNRDYSTLDVQRLQRVIVRYDTGFAAFPNLDPIIIGDINGSGSLTALDVTRLLQEVRFGNRPEIPPIPAGVTPLALAGPDPSVHLARDLRAKPGDTFVVPLKLDTTEGLDSVQLRLAWDARSLQLLDVGRGSVSGDFHWLVQRRGEGELYVDMSRLSALGAGSGSLLELRFRVAADAQSGVADLDLAWVSLNEGRLTLNPLPQPGPDAADGLVTIEAAVVALAKGTPVVAATPELGTGAPPSPSPAVAAPPAAQAADASPAPSAAAPVSPAPSAPAAAASAPAAGSHPGLLRSPGDAIQRTVRANAARPEFDAGIAAVAPLATSAPTWDVVQAPPSIDFASDAMASGWPSAIRSGGGWLHDFVAGDTSRRAGAHGSPRADVNAELKVTLPRVAPQLIAAGGIGKIAARR